MSVIITTVPKVQTAGFSLQTGQSCGTVVPRVVGITVREVHTVMSVRPTHYLD